MPPTLKTNRLVLRPQIMNDFATYRQFMMSERSLFMGGPFDEMGAWWYFCHDVAQWQFFGHGGLMVDLTATGRSVGQVGINHGPLFPEKELGWLIYEGHEGKGYATEAATALRDWAFRELRLDSLVSYIEPDNARSIAVAQRLGGTLDVHAPRSDATDLVYRHLASRV